METGLTHATNAPMESETAALHEAICLRSALAFALCSGDISISTCRQDRFGRLHSTERQTARSRNDVESRGPAFKSQLSAKRHVLGKRAEAPSPK